MSKSCAKSVVFSAIALVNALALAVGILFLPSADGANLPLFATVAAVTVAIATVIIAITAVVFGFTVASAVSRNSSAFATVYAFTGAVLAVIAPENTVAFAGISVTCSITGAALLIANIAVNLFGARVNA